MTTDIDGKMGNPHILLNAANRLDGFIEYLQRKESLDLHQIEDLPGELRRVAINLLTLERDSGDGSGGEHDTTLTNPKSPGGGG